MTYIPARMDGTEPKYRALLAAIMAGEPVTGYLEVGTTGRAIRTWDGQRIILAVTRTREARHFVPVGRWGRPWSCVSGKGRTLTHVWAADFDGHTWYGKGAGARMIITMRRIGRRRGEGS